VINTGLLGRLWAHSVSYPMVPGALTSKQTGRGVKLTTHLYLVLKLRMCGATPPLPYVFMAWCLVTNRDKFTFTLHKLGC